MGHADALAGKIEKGLCRKLLSKDSRQLMAMRWLREWGFSTSSALERLCLSKDDLPRMRRNRLIESKLIDISLTSNSRQRQMRIVFLSSRGRKELSRGSGKSYYLPPREPGSTLRHHNYLAQIAAISWIEKIWPKQEMRTSVSLLGAGHIRHKSVVKVFQHLDSWVPDFYMKDARTDESYFIELERASTIDRVLKSNRAETRALKENRYVEKVADAELARFCLKIEHLSTLGRVQIVYANSAARRRAQAYFESVVSSGIPKCYLERGRWRVVPDMFYDWSGEMDNIEWLNFCDLGVSDLLPSAKTSPRRTPGHDSRGSAP
ncbi:hypothetical protein [Fluviibacter phosphoraccumulans]|uniref:hypothetical protein n=1 Tax=Fluviibacter phosphoraccumulans TaxID=1751046 RepID=UPI0010B298A9|nr:hypothetical protein [Fluviibacter phosphoraccumulans]BCA65406.1 hypothetical protein SHINM1_010080 [Fluviibacter phosphoraccumulans]